MRPGCSLTPDGYPNVFRIRGKDDIGHRHIMRQYGYVLDGLTVDHICNNILCINPDHLQVCTDVQNKRLGMMRTCLKEGHTFDPSEVYVNVYTSGTQVKCRRCVSNRNRRAYLKRKGTVNAS